MRAVIQRVVEASVVVDDRVVGAIGPGLLVYVGAAADDEVEDARTMAQKIAGLRIFSDEADKMSRSVKDEAGSVLIVSQFTLFGDVRKGRRPSFTAAAPPERAVMLYQTVVELVAAEGITVATGQFRAKMQVASVGDGPVTILVDTRRTF